MHQHHDQLAAVAGSGGLAATCPVMDIVVDKAEATAAGLTRQRSGQNYYLCCRTCATLFDKDPGQYTGSRKLGGGK